jgi:hypothetical protein
MPKKLPYVRWLTSGSHQHRPRRCGSAVQRRKCPWSPLTDYTLQLEDGIVGRSALLTQLRAAQDIARHQPDRIVVLGGDCLVDLAPFAYLNERYDGNSDESPRALYRPWRTSMFVVTLNCECEVKNRLNGSIWPMSIPTDRS